jgi:hypothetical protein
MRSSILIKTYPPDLTWLRWAIKFLDVNWQEESELVIVAPNICMEEIRAMSQKFEPVLVPREEWGTEWAYVGQQFHKMIADQYCHGEYITFIDSDCMLFKPTTLEDLCVDGKPIIWTTPHSVLGDTVPWKRVVRNIMMIEPLLEYMRCQPITYKASTLQKCRAHLEKLHGTDLETMMRGRPHKSFSEFNVLGFYADVFDKKEYVFRDAATQGDWHRVKQFFSYGDWNEDMPRYLTELLEASPERPSVAAKVDDTPKFSIEVSQPADAQLCICTWQNDLDWLEYALKSVTKYWRSFFTPFIVATPECKDRLNNVCAKVRYEHQLPDHHRGQIYLKMTMDLMASPEPESLLFIDSDCLFTKESRYEDFCVDGKPIIHAELYDMLIPRSITPDQNCFTHYRQIVKEMLDIDAPAEYMRQQPFLFFKDTIKAVRDTIETRMGKPLLQVMEGYHSGYFSEFNLFGAYALHKETGRYHLAPVEDPKERRVHQFHSYSQEPKGNPIVEHILA